MNRGDTFIIYIFPKLRKCVTFCVFNLIDYYLCVSLSLKCWLVPRCLAEFINFLILGLYFWLVVAAAVPRELKLDSHKVLCDATFLLLLRSSQTGTPWVNIVLMCPYLDSKQHELDFVYVTRALDHSAQIWRLLWRRCIVQLRIYTEEYVAAERPTLCRQPGHLPRWPCF